MRDTQRKRVYTAEWRMSTKGTEYATLDEVKKRVNKIAMSKWWEFHFGKRASPLAVERGRGGAKAIGKWLVTFGKTMQNDLTIMHELAHIASGDKHGPEFARAYLLLVRRYMGPEVADELRGHLKEKRVRVKRQPAKAIVLQKYDVVGGYYRPKSGAFPAAKPRVVYEDPQPQEPVTDVSQTPEQESGTNPGAPLDYT